MELTLQSLTLFLHVTNCRQPGQGLFYYVYYHYIMCAYLATAPKHRGFPNGITSWIWSMSASDWWGLTVPMFAWNWWGLHVPVECHPGLQAIRDWNDDTALQHLHQQHRLALPAHPIFLTNTHAITYSTMSYCLHSPAYTDQWLSANGWKQQMLWH